MNKEERIYNSVCFFIVISIFIYVFSEIAGINVINYYPALNKWTVARLASPAIGYYGKILFSIPLASALSVLFYFLTPKLKINKIYFQGLIGGFILVGLMFFIVEEWHRWGVVNELLDKGGFYNIELVSFVVQIILFLMLGYLMIFLSNRNIK